MRTRIIAALVAIPIVVIPIYLGGFWGLALGVAVTIVGSLEMFFMLDAGGYRPARIIGVPWAVLLFLSGWNAQQVQRSSISITGILTEPTAWLIEHVSFPTASVLIAGLLVTLTYSLFVNDRPVHTWLSTSMGAIYLGVTLGQIVALRFLDHGFWYVLFGFLVTWANDTTAFFVGISVGNHKIWPRLSPKKSWEGTLAGWLGAAAAGAFLATVLPVRNGPIFGAVIGLATGVLALLGDLSISMIKRQVGVKDSGNIFPGHGGMLDRLDSLLFTLPFVYQSLLFYERFIH
ncbi:MAG: phosphatidate cytidylyltransferase [Caldilineaceae bacterium]|nr:phosphatidate cytidylyltransferase [Caldilineaceae bacterium]